jgi:hypothetical protein
MMAASGLPSSSFASGGQQQPSDSSQSKLSEFGDNLKQKFMSIDWIQNLLNMSRKTDSPEMMTIPLEERVNSLQSQNNEMRSVIEGLLDVLGNHGIALPVGSAASSVEPSQPQPASSSNGGGVVGLGLTNHQHHPSNESNSST